MVTPTVLDLHRVRVSRGMAQNLPDRGARVTEELAFIHSLFWRADAFYRLYREALLNGECQRDQPKPTERIPLSDH